MRFARAVVAAAVCILSMHAAAIDFSNRYRSPRNPERRVRKSTELIVLHTTEAPARSSLNKLKERGEAHYCVTEDGTVYRIVDRDRVAFHAGRSMWKGKEDVDEFSIGIECVGYHDKAMGIIQISAIRDLVALLKKMYRISDDCVVCHSHVAYGVPNRWQKQRHRGRKRCGMLFAMPSVREQLNLKKRPTSDADVRAKRLVVGDPYLKKVLYGTTDTMRGKYPATSVAAKKSSSGGIFSWLRGGNSDPPPKEPKAVIRAKPTPRSTRRAPPKSVADLKSRGYKMKGQVTKGTTASQIAGGDWNSADTYYTIRNKVIPGTRIDPAKIEKGMCVWMKK